MNRVRHIFRDADLGWFDRAATRALNPSCLALPPAVYGVDDDLNLYAYVYNDPLNRTDPSGLVTTCENKVCTTTADTFDQNKQTVGRTVVASPRSRRHKRVLTLKQERPMRSVIRLLVAEAAVIVVTVALISSTYIFVLPRYFDGRRTSSVLIVGLAIAAVAGACIARSAWMTRQPSGWVWTVAVSAIVTAATLLFSLFIILNTQGA
jgi:hypothetical protein